VPSCWLLGLVQQVVMALRQVGPLLPRVPLVLAQELVGTPPPATLEQMWWVQQQQQH
jgi:hypothetical protein